MPLIRSTLKVGLKEYLPSTKSHSTRWPFRSRASYHTQSRVNNLHTIEGEQHLIVFEQLFVAVSMRQLRNRELVGCGRLVSYPMLVLPRKLR